MNHIESRVEADLTDTSAAISSFSLDSDVGRTTASGTVSSFAPLKYDLNVGSSISLEEVSRLFKPDLRIAGETIVQGSVNGTGSDYHVAANITSGNVSAEGFQVRGVKINTKVNGHEDRYAGTATVSTGEATASGVDVNKTDLSAAISGHGSGFTVTGPLALQSLKSGNVTVSGIRGRIEVDRERVALSDLAASLLGGSISGSATLAYRNAQSNLSLGFKSIDLAQVAELVEAKDVAVAGFIEGSASLSFAGFNYRSAHGRVDAGFQASLSRPDQGSGTASATGQLSVAADGSGFDVEKAYVESSSSTVTAAGKIDWDGNGALAVDFDSKDMTEVQRALDAIGLI
ncbi:MAG: intermembrane phospholipid transport protein YdbH family protein, partial [Blastocatellia bacterium]